MSTAIHSELADGEDRLEAFIASCGRARAGVRRVPADGAVAAVVAALGAAGPGEVALAADLDDLLAPIAAACAAAGIVAAPYAELAADRARLGALAATVTGCAAAVAPTGSIVTSASAGRAAALIAPLHVCVVHDRQVLPGLAALMRELPRLGTGSLAALQTGPSRTADIEKVLVIPAHGPAAVEVVLVEATAG